MTAVSRHQRPGEKKVSSDLGCCSSDGTCCWVWVVTRLHGYNKWCCVMRLTSQSALLHSRILNCWDLSATPQPRYQLRHDQNSNSILSRVDIVKIFIHCKNIRGCRVSCLLEHNWGAAECGLLLLLGGGEILIYLIANVATDTVTSRGRPALYHHLTLPQEPSINNVINVRYLQVADKRSR